jgi:hypothetical protein
MGIVPMVCSVFVFGVAPATSCEPYGRLAGTAWSTVQRVIP